MDRIPTRLLPHTVTIERRTSIDGYGTPTYAAAVTYDRARVAYKSRLTRNAAGDLVYTRGTVLIDGDPPPTVSPLDRITLPDGSQPVILDAALVGDADGTPHHASVTFG